VEAGALADQPDDIRARASAAVRAAFAGRRGERSVMIDGATWIVIARRTIKGPSPLGQSRLLDGHERESMPYAVLARLLHAASIYE
jgi:hypothetical protein